ncbi:SCAN domain-containing protein 3-like [Palaemon carinicauda]|uniref:SCAN domain-containing protein 3-like n=1 Tax=Palaemon carinicauda TaxID=392227 RepID=UPI0035B65D4A
MENPQYTCFLLYSKIVLVTKRDKIRNDVIRGTTGVRELSDKIQESRLRWYGHVMRSDEQYNGRRVMEMEVQGTRRRGRLKRRWMDCIKDDLRSKGLTGDEVWDRDMSGAKKRKYSDEYIKYGFTVTERNGIYLPQCFICHTVLSNDALRPGHLERHLSTNHKALNEKPKEFFTAKLHELNHLKLDSSSVFHQETWKLVEASYKLSLLIAKAKKPHPEGETLVKPYLLRAPNTVLGEESQRKLSRISLSDNTVKHHIDELSANIKEQVLDKIKASRFFAIPCDESTNVAHLCQLLVYSRSVDEGTVKEEILYSAALETTAKVHEFFHEYGPLWEKLVGVCTDGAPAMIGSRSGFVKLVKEKKSAVTGTHCVIHRQSLASKTQPGNLRSSLNLAIKVVNFVKISTLNSRLFAALCSDLVTDYKTLLFHTEVR